MTIAPGVELIEKNKSIKGDNFSLSGQLSMDQYRNLHDPRQQQVDDTMKRRQESRQARASNNEDPYRAFRRHLINDQKSAKFMTRQRDSHRDLATGDIDKHSSISKGSRAGLQSRANLVDVEFSLAGSESNKDINQFTYGGRSRVGGKSMGMLDKSRIHKSENQWEMKQFLKDLSKEKDQSEGSMMMIEISDIDVKDPVSKYRAQTNKSDEKVNLSLKIPPTLNSVVNAARQDLKDMQQHSTLPRSNMSYADGLNKKYLAAYPGESGKIGGGLPPMRASIDQNRIQSSKSLNVSAGVISRISLYKNEDERHTMMKQINEQQANYQRLLAKQRKSDGGHGALLNNLPLKPKAQL